MVSKDNMFAITLMARSHAVRHHYVFVVHQLVDVQVGAIITILQRLRMLHSNVHQLWAISHGLVVLLANAIHAVVIALAVNVSLNLI